jgi:hypothetical protein
MSDRTFASRVLHALVARIITAVLARMILLVAHWVRVRREREREKREREREEREERESARAERIEDLLLEMATMWRAVNAAEQALADEKIRAAAMASYYEARIARLSALQAEPTNSAGSTTGVEQKGLWRPTR